MSRNVRPVDTAVLSITQFKAGDAYNVIPQTARLSGTVRAFSHDVMALIERNMHRVSQGVAESMGASAKVDFRVNFAPLINDLEQAAFAPPAAGQTTLPAGYQSALNPVIAASWH